jgi:hypothetical protein
MQMECYPASFGFQTRDEALPGLTDHQPPSTIGSVDPGCSRSASRTRLSVYSHPPRTN